MWLSGTPWKCCWGLRNLRSSRLGLEAVKMWVGRKERTATRSSRMIWARKVWLEDTKGWCGGLQKRRGGIPFSGKMVKTHLAESSRSVGARGKDSAGGGESDRAFQEMDEAPELENPSLTSESSQKKRAGLWAQVQTHR